MNLVELVCFFNDRVKGRLSILSPSLDPSRRGREVDWCQFGIFRRNRKPRLHGQDALPIQVNENNFELPLTKFDEYIKSQIS